MRPAAGARLHAMEGNGAPHAHAGALFPDRCLGARGRRGHDSTQGIAKPRVVPSARSKTLTTRRLVVASSNQEQARVLLATGGRGAAEPAGEPPSQRREDIAENWPDLEVRSHVQAARPLKRQQQVLSHRSNNASCRWFAR